MQEEVVKLRKIVSEIKKRSDAKAEACAVLLGALADAQEALALPSIQDMPGSDGLVPTMGAGELTVIRIFTALSGLMMVVSCPTCSM